MEQSSAVLGDMAKVETYDFIIVGTGFASSFFLRGFLKRQKGNSRVLVLERGQILDHAWQIENRSNSDIDHTNTFRKAGLSTKSWNFTIGFGGGSNCWVGGVPRMLPNDFRLKSLYNVGYDWPVSYDDLADYYDEAEDVMSASGPAGCFTFPPDKALSSAAPPDDGSRSSAPSEISRRLFCPTDRQGADCDRQPQPLLRQWRMLSLPGRCEVHDSERHARCL